MEEEKVKEKVGIREEQEILCKLTNYPLFYL